MPEEECKEHYEDLKAVIDIQLQKIISESDRDNQIDKSKKALDSLSKKYGKKS